MKQILLLNGNPKESSFCAALTDAYHIAAKVDAEVWRFDLHDMEFNSNLEYGYDKAQALEPCLVEFQKALLWAEHIVIVLPVWWGGIPAKLKGLFDRTLLPGFAFKYEKDNPYPQQLLTGKSSRLIITMDAPKEYMQSQTEPVLAQLDVYTLQFCGVKTANVTMFGSVVSETASVKQQWVDKVKDLGACHD